MARSKRNPRPSERDPILALALEIAGLELTCSGTLLERSRTWGHSSAGVLPTPGSSRTMRQVDLDWEVGAPDPKKAPSECRKRANPPGMDAWIGD